MTEHTQDDAEFQLSDLTVENAPITEGEAMCISCAVENTGSGAGARWVGVGVGSEALPVDKKKIQLAAGESIDGLTFTASSAGMRESDIYATLSLTESGLERGTDPAATTPVEVTTPAHFATTIESTNAPVEEGEDLTVTATVENTGGEDGTTTVVLASDSTGSPANLYDGLALQYDYDGDSTPIIKGSLVAGGETTIWDSESGHIPAGESQTVTLEWSTRAGNAGDHVLYVAGDVKELADQLVNATPVVGGGHDCSGNDPVDDTLVSVAQGPMRTGRFEVTIDEAEVPGWQTVTIPGKSVEQDTYRGDDDADEVPWGRVTFDDLEMERGVKPGDTRLHDWFEDIEEGKADEGRKEIAVKLLDEEGEMQLQWEFQEAWVKNYEPPDLDASADGDTATESITVTFDEMIRTEG